jgi:hypothetical protein
MTPSAGSAADYPGYVLTTLAMALAADAGEIGRKAFRAVLAKSPELVRLSDHIGEDPTVASVGFIDVLLASLRSDVELPWPHYEMRAREHGRL